MPKYLKISLSIVGLIVAVFLAFKIGEMFCVIRVNQAYKTLHNSYATAINNKTIDWSSGKMTTTELAYNFAKTLPTKKVCESGDKNCFPNRMNFRRYVGYQKLAFVDDYRKIKLKNGMSLAIKVLSPTCSQPRGRCATVFVDINGNLGPNKLGSDIFDFGIYKDELKPYELGIVHASRCLDGNGQGCAAYVLKYKSTNYSKYEQNLITELNERYQKEEKAFVKNALKDMEPQRLEANKRRAERREALRNTSFEVIKE